VLLRYSDNIYEAGCDEAGRGCLAGPVTAAAVILPDDFPIEILDDSKKLSEKKRNEIRPIIETQAITYAVAFVSPEEIDRSNILKASITAMHRALKQLSKIPEFIIVDGNKFYNYNHIPYHTVIKGDSKFASIAAASILAKTYRDDYMQQIHLEYPNYGWNKNKGYPTREHRLALMKYGISRFHRKTFGPVSKQLKLNL
jgi:ribonuclease HII